jgi:hypothetical protein|tara:strand:- start:264 stop:452 length:189 start_codon:yes stop_codon:yes gene_type:complete
MDEQNIKTLTEQFNIFTEEVEKFNEKGVAAAGTRARKALLEIAKLTKVIRKDIQDVKNEGKA